MKDLQQKHAELTADLCDRTPKIDSLALSSVMDIADLLGSLSHHTLKAYQGIRGELAEHQDKFYLYKRFLASKVANTVGIQPPKQPYGYDSASAAFVGMIEEVGELARAYTLEDKTDAVSDIVLYLMDYCTTPKQSRIG